jgi:hypothetical protein
VATAERSTWWLTRFVLLRLLGAVYLVAFLCLVQQVVPLVGHAGLLPVSRFLAELRQGGATFFDLPTIFWLGDSDRALRAWAWLGAALALAVTLGLTNAVAMALLWAIYLSFVHVGQIFYGYGWEMLLCEAGFLAIFLCTIGGWRPLDERAPPSTVVLWLYRWLLFRVMFGAGLIKLRGDACWRDLTCLVYHYETQPLPNPLSWLWHQAPPWWQHLCVLFNHLVEVIVPWLLFAPWRRVLLVAGGLQAAFQIFLILSGNLSWLNWLTLVLCVACFDDRALASVLPERLVARARALAPLSPTKRARIAAWALAVVVGVLSLAPITNLLSREQLMNASFDRLHLVNTYGAFGSVGRVRNEIILEGSDDGVTWREYEFKCKPGDPERRPCVLAPWQYRIDWQIWFAAMSTFEREPWLWRLVYKLLQNDRAVLGLLANHPFPRAPTWLRGRLYEYHFTRFGERGWWMRRLVGEYFPPLKRDELAALLAQYDLAD